MKIDRTVKKETLYIALVTLVLSVFMEGGFLVAGYYNYTVTLGNLLGATAAILNFFLLGISLQKALTKTDEKDAKAVLRASRLYRNFMVLAFCAVGALVPCFNLIAVLIPLFFPRLAIALRPVFKKTNYFQATVRR